MGEQEDACSSGSYSSSDEARAEVVAHSPSEFEAVAAVLEAFTSDNFPVELTEQARRLRWGSEWHPRVGVDYGDFIERHQDTFGLVPCPRPYVALVLPLSLPGCKCWEGRRRYLAWCSERRHTTTGKAKTKWRQVESKVNRLLDNS